MQPGDVLFVYHKARHAVKFYGPREDRRDYRVATSHDEIIPYLRELDGLRGNKRVYFFYTQWTRKQPFPGIKHYLGNVIGKEISHIPDPHGGVGLREAAAYRYVLSGRK
ncbi:hypothetical protein [Segetibacter aerophilus]|nr:hypothetical protein [Segetibacter aerophilus]